MDHTLPEKALTAVLAPMRDFMKRKGAGGESKSAGIQLPSLVWQMLLFIGSLVLIEQFYDLFAKTLFVQPFNALYNFADKVVAADQVAYRER